MEVSKIRLEILPHSADLGSGAELLLVELYCSQRAYIPLEAFGTTQQAFLRDYTQLKGKCTY